MIEMPDVPGERSFESVEVAQAYLRSELERRGILIPDLGDLAEAVIQQRRFIALSRQAPEFPTRFVVRDEDLGLIAAAQAAVASGVALAGAGNLSQAASAGAGLVVGVAVLVFKARTKGCTLDRNEIDVLSTLSARSMREDELLGTVNLHRVPALQLTKATVTVALDNLSKKRLRDGTVVALVARDARGLWSAVPHRELTWLRP